MVRALIVLALLTAGCRTRIAAERVSIQDADALWEGGGAFCARTPRGLMCWNTSDVSLMYAGPTLVDGITGLKDVALRIGEACVLDDRGVSCFRAGEANSTLLPFEAPSQLVPVDGYPGLVCVLHAKGVSCWGGDTRSPKLLPEVGKPRRLFAGDAENLLCAFYDDGMRCYEVNARGELSAAISIRGVTQPKSIIGNTTGGHLYVLDGEKVLYGAFAGTLDVGNPFAAKNPLDVEVSVHPLAATTVEPKPVPGLGPVRAMTTWSIWPLVLDDRGVVQLDRRLDAFENKRWPTSDTPSALFGGRSAGYFVTVEKGALHLRGRSKGDAFDREITGVTAPAKVVLGLYWMCALEQTGGIGCVRNPKK